MVFVAYLLSFFQGRYLFFSQPFIYLHPLSQAGNPTSSHFHPGLTFELFTLLASVRKQSGTNVCVKAVRFFFFLFFWFCVHTSF